MLYFEKSNVPCRVEVGVVQHQAAGVGHPGAQPREGGVDARLVGVNGVVALEGVPPGNRLLFWCVVCCVAVELCCVAVALGCEPLVRGFVEQS